MTNIKDVTDEKYKQQASYKLTYIHVLYIFFSHQFGSLFS